MSKPNWWKSCYAAFVLCAATATVLPAQTFTSLFSFDGTDGVGAWGTLIQATDGNFYGTTVAGGTFNSGTVFKITRDGTLTTLYSFCSEGSPCLDGNGPQKGVIQAADGNFYGTTYGGGATGSGTVFKITPDGTLTTLYSFCPQGDCPSFAPSGLIQATDGNFYGTTLGGSAGSACFMFSCGIIFKMTSSGTVTTLYNFCSQSDCADGNGSAGIIQASDGDFYGTTTGEEDGGWGTVFRVTSTGTLTTLYDFCSEPDCADGGNPDGTLIQASDGNFYGTTSLFGPRGLPGGTAFKITPGGSLTTLTGFFAFACAPNAACNMPNVDASTLIEANDGNFYGTTNSGGTVRSCYMRFNEGCGTVFKLTPSGALTDLHDFCTNSQDGQCPGGSFPVAGLVQDTNGTLYGTTSGTVFSLSEGLGPFVETRPTDGKVGASVKILGANLIGATSVTFNGMPAMFTVEAPSYIEATVPADATTGTVQVVTPRGTLSSNVPFRVAQ
jgi:uncharacterized repeat protein (TIGR03803 family)